MGSTHTKRPASGSTRRGGPAIVSVLAALALTAVAPVAHAQTAARPATGGSARSQPPLTMGARTDPEHDPREDEGGDQGEGPVVPRDADLMPMLPMASAAGWMMRPDPEPSTAEERGEEALDRYFDDTLIEDRTGVLGADGWYNDMGRGMRQSFHRRMQDGGMSELEGERRAGMNPMQVLFDELRRYGGGPERPIDPVGGAPREVTNGHFSSEEQAALLMQDQLNQLNAPTTWYRVDLHVVQNPEGVVDAVWVVRSSGYHTLDEAAVAAVHDGSVRLRPPPSPVTRGRDAIASEWAFEAGDVATYWNTAGCVDDPVHPGDLDCAALGRGIVRTRIRLLRVVDADHDSFEERRHRERESPPRLRD